MIPATTLRTQLNLITILVAAVVLTAVFIFCWWAFPQQDSGSQTWPIWGLFLLLTAYGLWQIDQWFFARLQHIHQLIQHSHTHQQYSRRLTDHHSDALGQTSRHVNALLDTIEQKNHQLTHQARLDNLTNLYNRDYLYELFRRIQQQNVAATHALIYCDLDNFKIINDAYGHLVGDQLLIELSQLLQQLTRPLEPCAVTRIGSDEFAILIQQTSEYDVHQLCHHIQQSIEQFVFNHDRMRLHVGISQGCVLFDSADLTRIDALLGEADTACYRAKDMGKNRFMLYWHNDKELSAQQVDFHWVQRIRSALKENRFELYLQPIVDAHQPDQPQHYEVLLRMMEGEQIIMPGHFIELAEKYHLSRDIDLWVMQRVCQRLASRPDITAQSIRFSINLSAISVSDPNFANDLLVIMDQHQLSSDYFQFEITETANLSTRSHAQHFIQTIHKAGIPISLDDFGTGMASFDYLRNLKTDNLKIDGSFISDILDNDVNQKMVEMMVQLGKIMNMSVTAEFVENQDTFDALKRLGVQHLQGYHIARPQHFDRVFPT